MYRFAMIYNVGLTVLLRKLCPKPRQKDTIPLESRLIVRVFAIVS